MAKSNFSVIMKIFSEASELLEAKECQTVVNGIVKILKGGEFNSKNLEKNMKVTVYWPEDESKPTGTVARTAPEMTLVDFDDGERHWIPNAWIVKAAAPKAE